MSKTALTTMRVIDYRKDYNLVDVICWKLIFQGKLPEHASALSVANWASLHLKHLVCRYTNATRSQQCQSYHRRSLI